MSKNQTIDIIGAGIGGLTTAIALEQKGFTVRIFEQAEHIKPVGAGIILANNAMQVLKKLGLKNVIEQHGNTISSMNITKSNLKLLSKIDLSYFERKHNTKNVAIHRGKLQQLLVNTLKTTTIFLNHRLIAIAKNDEGFDLEFQNGERINSTIVLGADGLNSRVRQYLFPKSNIRHANQICWRGVTDYELPIQLRNELNEAWGKKERFGFVQIAANKVYWYASKSFKNNPSEFSVDRLDDYFSKYDFIIKDLIKSTKKEHINTAELSDLEPTHLWFKDGICLIGDAAHAATPNMGQGACQAIEDAYVLSECLDQYESASAFITYQKLRVPKAHKIVKTSWTVGKIAHLSNPLLIGLRNQILRCTPSSMNRKQNEEIFTLAEI